MTDRDRRLEQDPGEPNVATMVLTEADYEGLKSLADIPTFPTIRRKINEQTGTDLVFSIDSDGRIFLPGRLSKTQEPDRHYVDGVSAILDDIGHTIYEGHGSGRYFVNRNGVSYKRRETQPQLILCLRFNIRKPA